MTNPSIRAGFPATATRVTPETVKEKLSKYPGTYSRYKKLSRSKRAIEHCRLTFYRELGEQFSDVEAEHAKGGVTALARALEISTTVLPAAMKLYRAYPDVESFRVMITKTGPDGKAITWDQLRQLLRQDLDAERRQAMIELCLSEGWTSRDMTREIQQRFGDLSHGNKDVGRKSQVPRHLDSHITKFGDMVRKVGKYSAALDDPNDGFEHVLKRTPPDKMTPAIWTRIDSFRAQLVLTKEVIDHELSRLNEIHSRFSPPTGIDATPVSPSEGPAPARVKVGNGVRTARDAGAKHIAATPARSVDPRAVGSRDRGQEAKPKAGSTPAASAPKAAKRKAAPRPVRLSASWIAVEAEAGRILESLRKKGLM
jgi:hypothetical protein